MESMKKFRIGSGLQNVHIRAPVLSTDSAHYACETTVFLNGKYTYIHF